jgi:hypothetical protein
MSITITGKTENSDDSESVLIKTNPIIPDRCQSHAVQAKGIFPMLLTRIKTRYTYEK